MLFSLYKIIVVAWILNFSILKWSTLFFNFYKFLLKRNALHKTSLMWGTSFSVFDKLWLHLCSQRCWWCCLSVLGYLMIKQSYHSGFSPVNVHLFSHLPFSLLAVLIINRFSDLYWNPCCKSLITEKESAINCSVLPWMWCCPLVLQKFELSFVIPKRSLKD